jgi:hypothetical protein
MFLNACLATNPEAYSLRSKRLAELLSGMDLDGRYCLKIDCEGGKAV